jgi:hypothetical protein
MTSCPFFNTLTVSIYTPWFSDAFS